MLPIALPGEGKQARVEAGVEPGVLCREALVEIDPELAESTLLFPDDETVANTYNFASPSEEVEAEYQAAFSAITGA